MKPIDILKLQINSHYPNLLLDIASAERLEREENFKHSGERYKNIGKHLLKLNLTVFSIDYYLRATEVFIKGGYYEKAIGVELTIFQVHRVNNNIREMASTYEKIASYFTYYLKNNETAGLYYFMAAKLFEENQNYNSAFKKARFACDCLTETNNIEKKINAHSLAFRMALQSGYYERAGIYATKWLELVPKDYSPHYISICMRGYKSFIGTERTREPLMFVNEIIIAHYDRQKPQNNIFNYLIDAQKLHVKEHKEINNYYNQKILELLSQNITERIKYSIEFKSYCQNLGLEDLADKFYLQEKELYRTQAKNQKKRLTFIKYSLWKYSCTYGTSLTRWFATSAIIIIIFGILYSQYEIALGNSNLELSKFLQAIKPSIKITSVDNGFSPYYYSVVTFATLGYGDITPNDLSGQIFSVIEVLTGYLMLGGLLSVFSKKIVR